MIKDRHEINVLFLRSANTLAQLVQLLMHKFIQKRQFEKLKADVDVQIYFNLNGHITCFVLPLEDPRTQWVQGLSFDNFCFQGRGISKLLQGRLQRKRFLRSYFLSITSALIHCFINQPFIKYSWIF